jgi:hypothetical protein
VCQTNITERTGAGGSGVVGVFVRGCRGRDGRITVDTKQGVNGYPLKEPVGDLSSVAPDETEMERVGTTKMGSVGATTERIIKTTTETTNDNRNNSNNNNSHERNSQPKRR